VSEPSAYERGGTQKSSYAPEELLRVPCPYCGGDRSRLLFREYGSIEIVRCECSQIYTSPRLPNPEHIYWGDRDAYHREAKLIFEGRAPHHRDPNYLEELRLIERFRAPGSFLDVGCNMGMLMRLARARGWRVTGVEPSPPLAGLARDELGLDVLNCFLNEVPASYDGSFDVVALSDVFEHVSEPLAMLRDVARLLKPDGLLYVKVPNALFNVFKQNASRVRGRLPQHGVWDSYEHVVHYTDRTLRRMLAKGGFDVLTLSAASPVQIPVWHERVGHYFLNPSPIWMDWKRHLGRAAFHRLGQVERLLRGGSVGYLSSSLAAVVRRSSPA
jgi:SAM-dependent methyltransferase